VEGREGSGPRAPFAPYFNVIAPNYFETLGIPVVAGRDITTDDGPNAPGVIVINEHMAAHLFPGATPIGKRVSFEGASGPWVTIVGVAHNTKYNSLGETGLDFMYLPFAQHYRAEMILHLRATRGARLTATALRDLV